MQSQYMTAGRKMLRHLHLENWEKKFLPWDMCVSVRAHAEGSDMIKQSAHWYSMPSVLPHALENIFTLPRFHRLHEPSLDPEHENERGLV